MLKSPEQTFYSVSKRLYVWVGREEGISMIACVFILM